MTETIEQKLDRLAEYHSQKDSIDAAKAAMLNEIKVPAEVLEVMSAAQKESDKLAFEYQIKTTQWQGVFGEKISSVVIPDEVKEVIAKIDAERKLLQQEMIEKVESLSNEMREKQRAITNHAQYQTAQVYADSEQRKQEINAEFAGKLDAVDENIKALEAEVKAEVKQAGASVKGKYLHAVYVKGRVSWNTDKIDAWCVTHPFLREARKEGEPSITIRRV